MTATVDYASINKAFLDSTIYKKSILTHIATHYGVKVKEAYEEVTTSEAEHLLDYITGDQRASTHLLMTQWALQSNGLLDK